MRFDFGYFLKEGVRGISRHGFMSFAAVVSIVACLIIMGSFVLVAVNAGVMLEKAESKNEILAFVDESLTLQEAKLLEPRLERIENVADARFVTREAAMDTFEEKYNDPALFAGLDASTFRHRLHVSFDDMSKMNDTVEEIRQVAGVADINYHPEISEGFVTIRNIATGIAVVLTAVLLAVSIFIISNTIRLSTFDRREEIAIMKMVGATDAFIRWPFVFQGILIGIGGAVIAFFLQWAVYGAVVQRVMATDSMGLLDIVPFGSLYQYVLIAFLVVGFAVGVGGSVSTIRKFLQV